MRIERGLSQRKLASKCGLDRGYISQLEAGKTSTITLTTAAKLAEGMGLPPSALIDMLFIEDADMRSFFTNELPDLDDVEKDWLNRTIKMVRERKNERQEYKAGKEEN